MTNHDRCAKQYILIINSLYSNKYKKHKKTAGFSIKKKFESFDRGFF